MTILCTCRGIEKKFAERIILQNINLDINEGEKIGLVGKNGSGKTTLAKILLGMIQPEKGSILWHQGNVKKGYLQQAAFYTAGTLREMLLNSAGKELLQGFLQSSSYLGLEKVQEWSADRLDGLSGGEKTKLALAAVWAEKPLFLILDEPTNHLDYQGVQWLIDELKRYRGTVLIISHDRYFLDETVDKIVEIEEETLHYYPGNYSFYRDEKRKRYESRLHAFTVQEKEKQKVAAEIKRLKNWSDKAHRESRKKAVENGGRKEYYRNKAKKKDKQVKSKLKQLEKLAIEGIEKPQEEGEVRFSFHQAGKKGRRILEVKNIAKKYGDSVLFKNSSFYVQRGDRIGLFGSNGCGKTTLLRILLGEEGVDSGYLFISPSARIAYLSQDVLDLAAEQTVLESLKIVTGDERNKAQTLLVNMGFQKDIMEKYIKVLSMGERTRIKMAGLMLGNFDLLILDEPTNHLDLHTRERLEETLEEYDGTILLVSHDRYLIERICDKMLIFEKDQIERVECGLEEYLEKRIQTRDKSAINIQSKEDRLIIENRITYVLGELSKYNKESPQYKNLAEEFQALLEKKKNFVEQKNS